MAITNITEALDALKTLAEGLPAAVTVDDTLSVEGAAADAKAVGDEFDAVGGAMDQMLQMLVSNEVFEPVAEQSVSHIQNTSNPHNVTAAQVTTASGKTVEDALEVPVLDLVSLGMTDLASGNVSMDLGDEEYAIIEDAFYKGFGQFKIRIGGATATVTAVLAGSGEIMFVAPIPEGIISFTCSSSFVISLYSFANSSHNQAASTITAGTFAGQVVASSTAQTPATMLLRNSKLVTTETNPSNNGEICWTYE